MGSTAEVVELKNKNTEKIIKILIADSHPVIRIGIESLLFDKNSYYFVGHASNSYELFLILNGMNFDIIVTEYLMLDDSFSDKAAMLERLRRIHPNLKIIVFTSLKNIGIINFFIKYKLQGILLKASEAEEINFAVKLVVSGKTYLYEKLRSVMGGDELYSQKERDILSLREAEILRMFLFGMTIKDIASKNHKNIKTVSIQKQSAFRKLGCKNNAEFFD